jgi:hypothetical protein
MENKDVRRMPIRSEELVGHQPPQGLPTIDLLRQMKQDAADLFKLEIELAKAETRQDLQHEIDVAKGVTLAAVCGIVGINMLLVAAIFAWARDFAPLVALIVGIILLLVGACAAFIGMHEAKKLPLQATRDSIKGDAEWVKQQIS